MYYLHILHSSGLSLTQHAEQQEDQLLNVLKRLLLGDQVRMHLIENLQHTQSQSVLAYTDETSGYRGPNLS